MVTFEKNLDKMQRKTGDNQLKAKAEGYILSATVHQGQHKDLYVHHHGFLTTATTILIL